MAAVRVSARLVLALVLHVRVVVRRPSRVADGMLVALQVLRLRRGRESGHERGERAGC